MKMLEANIKAERAGQIFGFIIFFSALAVGATLMILGQNAVGPITTLGSLAAIIGLFAYGRYSMKKELNGKR